MILKSKCSADALNNSKSLVKWRSSDLLNRWNASIFHWKSSPAVLSESNSGTISTMSCKSESMYGTSAKSGE